MLINNKYSAMFDRIAALSFDLADIYTQEMDESIENARFQEEKEYYERTYSDNLSSCIKMKNNSFALMMLNSKIPEFDTQNYKTAEFLALNCSSRKCVAGCADIKNILGKDFENIMENSYFSQFPEKELKKKYEKESMVERLNTESTTGQMENSIKKEKVNNQFFNENMIKKDPGKPKKKKELQIQKIEKPEKKPIAEFVDLKFSLDTADEEYSNILLDGILISNVTKQKEINILSAKPKKEETETKKGMEGWPENHLQVNKTGENPVSKKIQDTKKVSKNIHNSVVKVAIKEPEEMEILISDKENGQKRSDTDNDITCWEDIISPNDLIVDNYTIEYKNSEKETVKKISVLVTPLHLEMEDCFMTQIIVHAKSGNKTKTYVSEDISRPSIQIKINNESFIVRGSWVNGNFQTLLYPQLDNGLEIVKTLNSIRPGAVINAGHNINQYGNDIIHIFPLSSQNYSSEFVNIIVCVENKKNNLFQIGKNLHNKKIEIEPYIISAKWNNNRLISNIQKRDKH